jgi:hypothetical protein
VEAEAAAIAEAEAEAAATAVVAKAVEEVEARAAAAAAAAVEAEAEAEAAAVEAEAASKKKSKRGMSPKAARAQAAAAKSTAEAPGPAAAPKVAVMTAQASGKLSNATKDDAEVAVVATSPPAVGAAGGHAAGGKGGDGDGGGTTVADDGTDLFNATTYATMPMPAESVSEEVRLTSAPTIHCFRTLRVERFPHCLQRQRGRQNRHGRPRPKTALTYWDPCLRFPPPPPPFLPFLGLSRAVFLACGENERAPSVVAPSTRRMSAPRYEPTIMATPDGSLARSLERATLATGRDVRQGCVWRPGRGRARNGAAAAAAAADGGERRAPGVV